MRRYANRAATIAANTAGRAPCSNRRRFASARAARGVCQIPRVARFSSEQVVSFVSHQEFGSVGIPEEDGAGRFQPRNKRSILLGKVVPAEKGTGGAGPTGDINTTLDGEWHAMKRPEMIAQQNRIFRRAGLLAGSLGIQMDKRIQFRLQRLDAFKMEFDDLDRGDLLGANLPCAFRQRPVRQEAHGLMRESKRTCGTGQASGAKTQLGEHKNG